MIVLCDLDGTIADIRHRRHFVENGNRRWDEFHAACVDDQPNMPIIKLLDSLAGDNQEIHILSGRSDAVRAETVQWLTKHRVCYDLIRMRPAKDHQPDVDLKRKWLHEFYPDHRFDGQQIMLVIDDRQRVVDMWRAEGLTCLQCAPGDF